MVVFYPHPPTSPHAAQRIPGSGRGGYPLGESETPAATLYCRAVSRWTGDSAVEHEHALEWRQCGQPNASGDRPRGHDLCLDSVLRPLYVAGLLWPRDQPAPSFVVGLGPGQPGCTQDGISPPWMRWPLLFQDPVHGVSLRGHHLAYGLAVDIRRDILVS